MVLKVLLDTRKNSTRAYTAHKIAVNNTLKTLVM